MKLAWLPQWVLLPRSAAAFLLFGPSCRRGAGIRRQRAWQAAAVLLLHAVTAAAVEIPVPKQLKTQAAVGPETMRVFEPHESMGERRVSVDYRGFPMNALLDHWFGRDWREHDAELIFQALDGYRSVIAGSRLQRYRALLAFERADGHDFVVDNPAQRQTRVPLGPYYLIWDNTLDSELQALGTLGWPYQVSRIELTRRADDRTLIPPGASDEVKAGFMDAKDHCLTCHRIRGVGGAKYPIVLERAVCSWTDERLRAFIDNPRQLRPGTSMPAIDGSADPASRQKTIERIVAYLNAVKAADAACSEGSSGH
ncbi:MAG: cytochrome c family protein [Methylotetracoccus sp.]|nr:cytochrome c family protein [Methylotetracoccus sp.]